MTKEKIIKQVDYYFGDINLPRDKFLLEAQKSDDGWVPLETMLKFNRLAQITKDIDEIAKALRDSELMDVSEDNKKIRRRLECPLPDNNLEYWQEIKKRTVYMKGFDEDTTLDDIQAFLELHGNIKNIIMRRTRGTHIFKGSIFVTFTTKDEANAFLENKDVTKYKENDLTKCFQDDYWANKQKEIKEKKAAQKILKNNQKKAEEEDQKNRVFQTTFVKGALLKVKGFPTNLKTDTIKDFFRNYGDPAFVIIKEDFLIIRFNTDTEDTAKEIWDKAVKAGNGTTVIFEYDDKEYLLEGEVMVGEDEQMYWLDFHKSKLERQAALQENSEGKRNRGGRRGAGKVKGVIFTGGKKTKGEKRKRKRAEQDGEIGNPPKRSVHIKFD